MCDDITGQAVLHGVAFGGLVLLVRRFQEAHFIEPPQDGRPGADFAIHLPKVHVAAHELEKMTWLQGTPGFAAEPHAGHRDGLVFFALLPVIPPKPFRDARPDELVRLSRINKRRRPAGTPTLSHSDPAGDLAANPIEQDAARFIRDGDSLARDTDALRSPVVGKYPNRVGRNRAALLRKRVLVNLA